MKIIKRRGDYGMFPMNITCKRVVDEYGFAYGDEKDFISETKRCELLIRRLWEQEIPRPDNIF